MSPDRTLEDALEGLPQSWCWSIHWTPGAQQPGSAAIGLDHCMPRFADAAADPVEALFKVIAKAKADGAICDPFSRPNQDQEIG